MIFSTLPSFLTSFFPLPLRFLPSFFLYRSLSSFPPPPFFIPPFVPSFLYPFLSYFLSFFIFPFIFLLSFLSFLYLTSFFIPLFLPCMYTMLFFTSWIFGDKRFVTRLFFHPTGVILRPFSKVTRRNGEPLRAVLMSWFFVQVKLYF